MLNYSANGPSGYNLTNSLRFRKSASACLSRTPTSTGSQQKFTLSLWVKLGDFSTGIDSFIWASADAAPGGVNPTLLWKTFDGTYKLYFDYGTSGVLITNAVFRDPSAWYHIVINVDTTQATASNRTTIYVNNVLQTYSTATYPAQNTNFLVNTSSYPARLGAVLISGSNSRFFDGYMAEVNFIDGQALTPSSFGNTNSATGVWQPAKYTGTYGTNGFYLNFNSIALTSGSNTGLGKDNSGNGNYWNTNNISVTAGTTYDAMTDVPTLTSATVANYPVMNPIDKGTTITVNNANLGATISTTHNAVRGTFALPTSGKWYWETTVGSTTSGTVQIYFGICSASTNLNTYDWNTVNTYTLHLYSAMQIVSNGSVIYDAGSGVSAGAICNIAYDADNGKLYLGINNTYYSSAGAATGNPTTGTNPTLTPASGTEYYPYFGLYNNSQQANFGQRPFTYTPPTGFNRLNTYNLPTPTILQGNKYMDATLATGNTGVTQTFTNGGFYPDFIWSKSRSSAGNNVLINSITGTTKFLRSNTTDAEASNPGLDSFNSNGFTETNMYDSGITYVAWQWQAGKGSTSSNTSGSITSTVSVNTTAGFSVVTYTGTGANATVGHGLGVAPKMVIVKSRSYAGTQWVVWHTSLTSGAYTVYLNLTNAQASAPTVWNSTTPTSTVFSVGTNADSNNSGSTYVAYCWAEIAGFSKFGSYIANASADGPFIYTGFRPKYILIKGSVAGNNWVALDTSRNTYNVSNAPLLPNLSSAESANADGIDILSNGFKIRVSGDDVNYSSGATYIYAAFAENPFKNALAR